uniref:WD_REPEATS_REGION domain-containing protein n=1 Tax=Meloidogyne hapla TaxID=6305 RepID=A0A1I8BNK1_MELHA
MSPQIHTNYSNNKCIYNKCPDELIQSFCSFPHANDFEWVSARFSPHPQQEHTFVLGNECGSIAIFSAKDDLNQFKFIRKGSPCLHSVILDFCFLPGIPDWLVALSGNSHIYLIDITNGKPIYYLSGHSCSVRCVSVWPENPYLLVSGSRDGSILGWDLRSPPSEHITTNGACLAPSRTFAFAHEYFGGLLHFGENYVISSSSSSASSGIRIWDLRYVTGAALRTLKIPQEQGGKEAGISSMCWDRFNSSFFASCTDNKIHEYLPASGIDLPVRSLNSHGIDSFYVQCTASPISDHLICGSSRNKAFIWDLQFECIQWSQGGKYFLTLGRDYIRLWSNWNKKLENGYPKEAFSSSGIPLKFDYPILLSPIQTEINERIINPNNCTLKLETDGRSTPPNIFADKNSFLANLPAIYFSSKESSLSRSQVSFNRTPKKLVLKGNATLTPACKISRIEGNENQHRTPGKSRNLSASFQSQRTPGSSGKKRRRTSPKLSSQIRTKGARCSQRLQKQNKEENTNSSNTPTGILKYLSPVENKRKNS